VIFRKSPYVFLKKRGGGIFLTAVFGQRRTIEQGLKAEVAALIPVLITRNIKTTFGRF